jgi:hypothetical protein
MMDEQLNKILVALPDKPPRSRLELYRDLIEELRRRDRTFREISEILAEKCQVQVTASGIHDFLRTRSRREKSQAIKPTKPTRLPVKRPIEDTLPKTSSSDEVQRKIAELKARRPTAKPNVSDFEYDPDAPLRLKRTDHE